jgi:hypothetical protein
MSEPSSPVTVASPGPRSTALWTRWKRLAQRAAEAQGAVVFFVLYYVAFVPMAVIRPRRRRADARDSAPRWIARAPRRSDLDSVRRQF